MKKILAAIIIVVGMIFLGLFIQDSACILVGMSKKECNDWGQYLTPEPLISES